MRQSPASCVANPYQTHVRKVREPRAAMAQASPYLVRDEVPVVCDESDLLLRERRVPVDVLREVGKVALLHRHSHSCAMQVAPRPRRQGRARVHPHLLFVVFQIQQQHLPICAPRQLVFAYNTIYCYLAPHDPRTQVNSVSVRELPATDSTQRHTQAQALSCPRPPR